MSYLNEAWPALFLELTSITFTSVLVAGIGPGAPHVIEPAVILEGGVQGTLVDRRSDDTTTAEASYPATTELTLLVPVSGGASVVCGKPSPEATKGETLALFQLIRRRISKLQRRIDTHQFLRFFPFLKDLHGIFPDREDCSALIRQYIHRLKSIAMGGDDQLLLDRPFQPKILLKSRTWAKEHDVAQTAADSLLVQSLASSAYTTAGPSSIQVAVGAKPRKRKQFGLDGGTAHNRNLYAGAARPPVAGAGAGQAPTTLEAAKLDHAARFCEAVRCSFRNEPQMYHRFLALVKSSPSDVKAMRAMVEEVRKLLCRHPRLLDEFAVFVGPEYADIMGVPSSSQALPVQAGHRAPNKSVPGPGQHSASGARGGTYTTPARAPAGYSAASAALGPSVFPVRSGAVSSPGSYAVGTLSWPAGSNLGTLHAQSHAHSTISRQSYSEQQLQAGVHLSPSSMSAFPRTAAASNGLQASGRALSSTLAQSGSGSVNAVQSAASAPVAGNTLYVYAGASQPTVGVQAASHAMPRSQVVQSPLQSSHQSLQGLTKPACASGSPGFGHTNLSSGSTLSKWPVLENVHSGGGGGSSSSSSSLFGSNSGVNGASGNGWMAGYPGASPRAVSVSSLGSGGIGNGLERAGSGSFGGIDTKGGLVWPHPSSLPVQSAPAHSLSFNAAGPARPLPQTDGGDFDDGVDWPRDDSGRLDWPRPVPKAATFGGRPLMQPGEGASWRVLQPSFAPSQAVIGRPMAVGQVHVRKSAAECAAQQDHAPWYSASQLHARSTAGMAAWGGRSNPPWSSGPRGLDGAGGLGMDTAADAEEWEEEVEPRDERAGLLKKIRVKVDDNEDRGGMRRSEFTFYIPHKTISTAGGKDPPGLPKRLLQRNERALIAAQYARGLFCDDLLAEVRRSDDRKDRSERKRQAKATEGWDTRQLARLVEQRAVAGGVLALRGGKLELASSGGAGRQRPNDAGPGGTWCAGRVMGPGGDGLLPAWVDSRACALCGIAGDRAVLGRLLFVEVGVWAHVGCLCWSTRVYEDTRERRLGKYGMLCGVHDCLAAAQSAVCDFCGCAGASVECSRDGCVGTWHFGCAVVAEHAFLRDNWVLCQPCRAHAPTLEACGGGGALLTPAHMTKMWARHLRVMPRSRPRIRARLLHAPSPVVTVKRRRFSASPLCLARSRNLCLAPSFFAACCAPPVAPSANPALNEPL